MSRDLQERLALFSDEDIDLRRIALNMPQVEEIKPPENPAKVTDSRFQSYMQQYGTKSWELDALSPTYLANLLQKHIEKYIDVDEWEKIADEIEDVKVTLSDVSAKLKR